MKVKILSYWAEFHLKSEDGESQNDPGGDASSNDHSVDIVEHADLIERDVIEVEVPVRLKDSPFPEIRPQI